MPRDLSISHWSRPRAVRTLRAIWRLGGTATTWQIAEQTRSMAVHSDVDHLRCLCQAEGVCDASDAVEQSYARMTDTGARVSFYSLSNAVRWALREGQFNAAFAALDERDQARLEAAKAAHAERVARRRAGSSGTTTQIGQIIQDRLFSMALLNPEQTRRGRKGS